MGVRPKFSGNWQKASDPRGNFIHDKGFWKLLIDRRMYECRHREGANLQSTALGKPRTGLPLYRYIMSDVFNSKDTDISSNVQGTAEIIRRRTGMAAVVFTSW